jgi:hypothetical protein
MKRALSTLLLLLILGSTTATRAQIGMGGPPHSSAVLDLKSPANDKAFYPPRLTTAQRLAIASPQVGAMVYDGDKGALYLYDGQNWLPLATTSNNNLLPIDRTASDGAAGDQFGYSVAISGDYAIVGAHNDDIGSNQNQGSAYIFVQSGNSWNQQTKITASDGAASDKFGYSVAISGDYAIVGTYTKTIGSNIYQGAAYVFARSGNSWNQQTQLIASDGAANDAFGSSVAISGDYAIVGADNKIISSSTVQGVAYIFSRSGNSWSQQARLTASDGTGYYFGTSVAISGDYAIVGSSGETIGSNTGQGAAYLFVLEGGIWSQQTKIIASDGTVNDEFGTSVAILGDYAIVGSPSKTIGSNTRQGAAYVFSRIGTSWNQQAILTASDGNVYDQFGVSLSVSGRYAIVGALKTIGSNTRQGAAYVFMRSGTSWTQTRRVTDAAPANTNNGFSVGLLNGTFLIGGPGFQNSKGKVAFGTVD